MAIYLWCSIDAFTCIYMSIPAAAADYQLIAARVVLSNQYTPCTLIAVQALLHVSMCAWLAKSAAVCMAFGCSVMGPIHWSHKKIHIVPLQPLSTVGWVGNYEADGKNGNSKTGN
jgi:hypothetical protein